MPLLLNVTPHRERCGAGRAAAPGGSPQHSAPSETRCADPPAAPGSECAAAPRRSAAFHSDFGASHCVRRCRCLCTAPAHHRGLLLRSGGAPPALRDTRAGKVCSQHAATHTPYACPATSCFLQARRTHKQSHARTCPRIFQNRRGPFSSAFSLSLSADVGWARGVDPPPAVPPAVPTLLELGAPLPVAAPSGRAGPATAASAPRAAAAQAGGCTTRRAGKLEREPRWREGSAAPELRGSRKEVAGCRGVEIWRRSGEQRSAVPAAGRLSGLYVTAAGEEPLRSALPPGSLPHGAERGSPGGRSAACPCPGRPIPHRSRRSPLSPGSLLSQGFPIPQPIHSSPMLAACSFVSPLSPWRGSRSTPGVRPHSSSVSYGDGSAPPRGAPLAPKIRLSSGSLREGTRSTELQPRSSLPPRCSVPARGCARRWAPAVPGVRESSPSTDAPVLVPAPGSAR